jgi:hypothetical protein
MDQRRPYRPKPQWQRPQRRSRSWSIKDWMLVILIGGAALSQVVPGLKSAGTVATTSPQGLADIQSSAFYPNCDAARAAGVAPLHVGDPGYRDKLDADSDGIACEPYYGQ